MVACGCCVVVLRGFNRSALVYPELETLGKLSTPLVPSAVEESVAVLTGPPADMCMPSALPKNLIVLLLAVLTYIIPPSKYTSSVPPRQVARIKQSPDQAGTGCTSFFVQLI